MRRFIPSCVLVVGLLICAIPASPAMAGVRQQLRFTLPEVNFSGVGLADAFDFLRDVSGANIAVNWKALEEAGVAKDTVVNVRLRQVSLGKALEMVLAEAGGGDKLAYDIDQNVISVTTTELANARMITRVYPIQDLILEIPDFTDAPDLTLNTTSNNATQNPGNGTGMGSGNATSIIGSMGSDPKPITRDDRAKAIVDLVLAVIQPEIWQENGGKAAIRYWNGNLIVTAPRSVQEAIGGAWN